MSALGLFVSGTDTGVGKTLVACALLRGLRARGFDAVGLKPIETGVGEAGPLDGLALRAAAGDAAPLEEVCPQRFALPAAPTLAANAEGRSVDLEAIRAAHRRLSARHGFVVVEGAGGLLVPAAGDMTMADLARELGRPLLIVARAALGTINHTRLTLEAAAARGLPVLGVVISYVDGPLSAADETNLSGLRRELGSSCLGEIPPVTPSSPPPEEAIHWKRLLKRVEASSRGG
jgi:dethiobiotin synthetase